MSIKTRLAALEAELDPPAKPVHYIYQEDDRGRGQPGLFRRRNPVDPAGRPMTRTEVHADAQANGATPIMVVYYDTPLNARVDMPALWPVHDG